MAESDGDRWAVRISFCGWLASFVLPATNHIPGFAAFFAAVFYPPAWPAFAANVLYWIALRSARYAEWAETARFSWIALALSLSVLLPLFPDPLSLDFGWGLWASSMGLLAVFASLRALAERTSDSESDSAPAPGIRFLAAGPAVPPGAGAHPGAAESGPPRLMTCFACRRQLPRPPVAGRPTVTCPQCGSETPVPASVPASRRA